MPHLDPVFAARPESPDAASRAAFASAASAVLALRFNRATLRPARVRAAPGAEVLFEAAASPSALRLNRALLEETVVVALAGRAAEEIKFGAPALGDTDGARATLAAALEGDEAEEAVLDAHLTVLAARARALLRRAWAEVEVVAAALHERGALDGAEVEHRVRCAQGIMSATLN